MGGNKGGVISESDRRLRIRRWRAGGDHTTEKDGPHDGRGGAVFWGGLVDPIEAELREAVRGLAGMSPEPPFSFWPLLPLRFTDREPRPMISSQPATSILFGELSRARAGSAGPAGTAGRQPLSSSK